MLRTFGPSKGNRRPTQAAPGSKGRSRPAPQKGGGGNKSAGSVEPTAANSPTVSVSSDGTVTVSNQPTKVARRRATRRAVRAQTASRKRVAHAVRETLYDVTSKPNSVPVLAKSTDKPSEYRGSKTAGTPTLAELREGERDKTLRLNKSEALTTPKVRSASRGLTKARKAYKKVAEPHISGLRNKAQEEFAVELSKKAHLPPKLAGEWVLQESGASSAGAGGEAGEQNQLGVGYPAHPTSFSESPYFNNTTPKKAADATAKWMEGKIGGEYGYQAASSIQGIPSLAKSGASEAQIRAYIEGPSAWGTGTIAQSGVTATPGRANPKVTKRLKVAKKLAKEAGLPVNPRERTKAERVNYLKVFGKEVGQTLKAVTKSKGYADNSSTKAITIHGPGGGTLVRDVQGSSGVASVINVNKDPEIAARLLLLSKKTGKTIYVLSGYRTPAQAVAVGGFADDPHTKGEAMDIGVDGQTIASANSISEAEYESVGLYRPFGTAHGGSSAEDNHVQLLNDGTPATGTTGAGASSGSTSGGSTSTAAGVPVPAPIVNAYAESTGKSPKQVKRQIAAGRLSVLQIYRQLQSLGIVKNIPGQGSSSEEGGAKKPSLSDLEAKYHTRAA